ncbi:MAG: helix-turn-helix domain-containing protein [Melioribacteraceae bacterium]
MDYQEFENVRKKIGWNKRELANRLGIGERTIHGYIRNEVIIPKPIAKLITAYMDGYRPKEE